MFTRPVIVNNWYCLENDVVFRVMCIVLEKSNILKIVVEDVNSQRFVLSKQEWDRMLLLQEAA